MFFLSSKVIFFLITPSNLLILAVLAGAGLLATRLRRTGTGLVLAGGLGLLLGGLTPLSTWVMLPLENRFPEWRAGEVPPAGIVVLGGGVETGLSAARGQFVGNDADERQIFMADLARRFPQARLVFTGGNGSPRGGVSEADVISRNADTLGLPRSRLILENRSRNTHENAAFTAALVQPKPGERWLLVTSAWHMPRAVGCFRQAGFTVEPHPVDYRTAGWREPRFGGFSSEGLLILDLAVKEWLGLVAYRLAGYTPDWLPGPAPAEPSR